MLFRYKQLIFFLSFQRACLVCTKVFDRISRRLSATIMGIQDLQVFLENEGVGVDLFRIARTQPGGFRLVLDAEGCLDRLYGGYFSGRD